MPTQTSPQFLSKLPPGYSVGRGPDGVQYIVPNYLVPATDLALRSQQQKSILNVHLAAGGPLSMDDLIHDLLTPAAVRAPAIPSLTERELLAAHAEIKALQQRYGLSYKDAAHRLYHAEVQQLVVQDEALRSISEIRQQIDNTLGGISEKIMSIDEGNAEKP